MATSEAGMAIALLSVTARAAAFELAGATGPEPPAPVPLRLDGVAVGETAFAVWALEGLEPDRDYRLRAGDGPELQFRTRPETARLDPRRFGARGDGRADDTAALRAAIAACPEGGTVMLEAGVYSSAPLFLKSGITLHLARGAVLRGRAERAAYPILPGRLPGAEGAAAFLGSWEGEPEDCFAALITGIGVRDVAIVGLGTIDGNAAAGDWWIDAKVRRGAWRPRTVFLNGCRDVRMLGVTVTNSPSWTIHPLFCDGLRFHALVIANPPDSPNTDGLNPESCDDVEIVGARISVGDDCVAIKSGKLFLGRLLKRPCRNLRLRLCRMERGHGAVVIGSEMAGGVRDVEISRCLFRATDRGLRVKTRRGRGADGVVAGIALRDCRMEGVGVPLTVNSFYFCDADGRDDYVQDRAPRPIDAGTPAVRDIVLERVEASGARHAAAHVAGLPERPITGLVLRDVHVAMDPAATAEPPEMACHIEPMARAGFVFINVEAPVLDRITASGVAGPLFPSAGGLTRDR